VVVVESIAITDTKVPVESEANAAGSSASSSKKKKKKAKFSFDDFSFDDVDNSKGGKQKQSTEEPALSEDVFIAQESSSSKAADDDEERGVQEDNEDEAEMAPVQPADGLTMEQRARKEKPKSRIRFAESSQPDFVMMSLDHVSLIYGNDVILKDATLSVSTGQRVGLVGPNGSGKTTQMKILAGELEPTTGDVVKSSKDLRVAMLRQEFIDELDMTRTLREELLQAFDEEQRLLKGITELEEEVSRTTDDPERMEQVLNKLQDLQDKAIAKGAYSLDSKVDKIMDATGFTVEDGSALVKSFSGGWKMRIGLAKILLKDPNVLLLDEPTNHLDLESVSLISISMPYFTID
jgi:ABC-type cobalamin/Fe3+-siderophores transport system ATPase subunit